MAQPKDAPATKLASKDYEDLLDLIDTLRSEGVSRYVALPQLIVCGDQSSGKSSVLEAISGVRFPANDELCTRFATELILRRHPSMTVQVKIVPSSDRLETERERLANFTRSATDLEQFEQLVESAKIAMGISDESSTFSRDVLKVVVSGPDQPHLTLVDLPGLFQAGNKRQSDADAEVVRSLVLSYMRQERSIILAVVSAKNDFANQIVTRYAREVDPAGERTLGIITKPDTLHAGSGMERKYMELAQNKDLTFRLGWHSLKNSDFDTKDVSTAERDRLETLFFSQDIWPTVSRNNVGIKTLRPRLCNVPKQQILVELPTMIEDVQKGVRECRAKISLLGESRGSTREQRLYVSRVCKAFTDLIKDAISGHYNNDTFFGTSASESGYGKRLRAVVQNTDAALAQDMRTEGMKLSLSQDAGGVEAVVDFTETDDESDKNEDPNYVDQVMNLMKRTRGCELPGIYNSFLITELFREMSRGWRAILDDCMEKHLAATKWAINAILEHVADSVTARGLSREIILPKSRHCDRTSRTESTR